MSTFGTFGTAAFSFAPAAGQPIYDASAVRFAGMLRFNPLRTVTPASLANALDAFDQGWLGEGARIFKAIADRDDTIVSVKPKRELAASEADWQIATVDGADPTKAAQHAAALKHFYNNLRATSAVDRNQTGGFAALRRQMMTAASYRYCAHHIVWKPGGFVNTGMRDSIPAITAEFEFVPLEYFENTTGRLRYVEMGNIATSGIDGVPLNWESGEWMVTCGDGLMFAAAICYMFKRLSLTDWVEFCQTYAQGKVVGRTTAAKDSPAGLAFAELVASFTGGSRAVIYGDTGDVAKPIETYDLATQAGADVFAKLIERMDRKIAAMYRGADLSTMSAGSGEGSGASLQGDEGDLLLRADVRMLTESLWSQVDAKVIEWTFGRGVKPLAYVSIPLASDPDLAQQRESAGFLADRGVAISAANICERLGFSPAADGEAALGKAATPGAAAVPLPALLDNSTDWRPAFNAKPVKARKAEAMRAFLKAAVGDAQDGLAEDMATLRIALEPLRIALEKGDDAEVSRIAGEMKKKLPALSSEILRAPSSLQYRLTSILAPAVLDGLISGGEQP